MNVFYGRRGDGRPGPFFETLFRRARAAGAQGRLNRYLALERRG